MVKFKMKVLLILLLIAIILYVTTFANFLSIHSFFNRQDRLDYVDNYENADVNSRSVFLRLVENSVLSLKIVTSQDAGDNSLVGNNLSKVKEKDESAIKMSVSVRDKSAGSTPAYRFFRTVMSFSYNSSKNGIVHDAHFVPDEIVTVLRSDVQVRSIARLIGNKTVFEYFRKRRELMLNECSKNFNDSSVLTLKREKLEHILVNKKNKLLFCYIPKVACTNWKRMFMILTGKADNITHVINIPSYEIHAKNMLASLQNYSRLDIDFFIRNYSKVIFVRNPLERLLSAYRNKLEQHYNSSKYFQRRFGKYIIKNFRTNPSNESLVKGDDVTFEEFVKYLLHWPTEQYNEHWQTMNDLCHPCFMKYDVIGRYDTLEYDSKSVLSMFNVTDSFPTIAKPSITTSKLIEYYGQLSPELIKGLYKIYEMDFRLFGYDIQKILELR